MEQGKNILRDETGPPQDFAHQPGNLWTKTRTSATILSPGTATPGNVDVLRSPGRNTDMGPLERADTLMRRTLLETRDIILRARYRFIYWCYINTDIIFERFFLKTTSFRIKRFRPLTSVIIRLS